MTSVISGDANVSATEFGFLDGVTSGLQSQIDSKLPLAGGKILQIVRATDTTNRSTTSTSFVDVTGMSVTITPQKSDSAILVIMTAVAEVIFNTADYARIQITDSSNNPLPGSQDVIFGTFRHSLTTTGATLGTGLTLVGYSTPATTSPTTYKARFRVVAANMTVSLYNGSINTGQMFAIEVSA